MAFNPLDYLKDLVPENTNIFGASPNPNIKKMYDMGLLGKDKYEDVLKKTNRQSVFQGLLNTGLSYAAQPKNQNLGSIIPYLAKAGISGAQAAQGRYDQMNKDAMMSQQLSEQERLQTLRDELLKDPTIANDPLKKAAAYQNPVEVYKMKFQPETPLAYNIQELNSEIASLSLLPEYANKDESLIRNQAFKNIQERKKGQNQTIFKGPEIESSYDETIGKGRGEQDLSLIQEAERVPVNLRKMDDTVALIRNPNTNVGAFADFETKVNAAKDKFLNVDGSISESVSNTQLLDSMLGSDVFPMIKALGIGARGLDTPAERKFLQKVMTGEVTLTRDTLTKMTMIRRRQFEQIAKDYNIGLDTNRFKRVKKIAGLNKIDLKSGSDTPLISQGKNNETGQTFNIYADGSSYYLDDKGNVTDNKVNGFNWLQYNYDF